MRVQRLSKACPDGTLDTQTIVTIKLTSFFSTKKPNFGKTFSDPFEILSRAVSNREIQRTRNGRADVWPINRVPEIAQVVKSFM